MRSSLIFDESASIFSSASSISRCLSSLWSRRAWMLRLILSRFDLCCSICASCERRPLIAFLREPPVTSPPLAYTSPSRVTILNARSYFFQMRSALSILSTMTTLPSNVLTKSSNLGSQLTRSAATPRQPCSFKTSLSQPCRLLFLQAVRGRKVARPQFFCLR